MIEQQPDRVAEPLEEDRSAELEQLQIASQRLLEVAGTGKWLPRELQAQARNGHPPQMTSLAFWQLLNDGSLKLDADLKVRRVRRP
jgi:hypothetical protein